MKRLLRPVVSGLLLVLAVSAFAANETAGVKPDTAALYQKARDQVSNLTNSSAVKYAPETVKQAEADVAAAQSGLEQGNDRATRQSAELAIIQVKLALALADERIAAEKTVAAQQELTRLEQRLTAILSGKGEKP